MNVLVIDVGGSHVKIMVTGQKAQRRMDSGPNLTAAQMAAAVRELAKGWKYDRVSIGYPGVVVRNRPITEPHNLGRGWVGFDYEKAFGKPVRIVNDAAMQALGDYKGGKMLFLGLGTGLGTTLIVDGTLVPMEAAHLPYKKATFEDYVGERAVERDGKKKWRKNVNDVITRLAAAFIPDEIAIGGGNARLLNSLPPRTRICPNTNAFAGGFRLWADAAPAKKPRKAAKRARKTKRK
jgi:polyphosphate glucokinase